MDETVRYRLFSPNILSFTLVLLINSLLFSTCYCIDEQGQPLLTWKNSLNSPTDALKTWNPADSIPCKWLGIHCNTNGEVVKVSLKALELEGSVPSNFQSLKSLKILIISSCNLTETIPKEIGEFGELTFIDLSDNSLSVHNLLTGSIPRSFEKLEKLQGLSLWNNSLEGAIPDDLGNCTELTYLDISINLLTGSIPRIDGDGNLIFSKHGAFIEVVICIT
ncbi:hypothetical protein Patl1_03770 [Pistacia atlantica]|uniref:Uncharacterized protein n=1 Tax=Pistacia atlantica TaxID=434234 RepID=A0ACC1BW42_9ROSI|nr:hypothetical protein Patl1_03770 [Pistacia atlantica]